MHWTGSIDRSTGMCGQPTDQITHIHPSSRIEHSIDQPQGIDQSPRRTADFVDVAQRGGREVEGDHLLF